MVALKKVFKSLQVQIIQRESSRVTTVTSKVNFGTKTNHHISWISVVLERLSKRSNQIHQNSITANTPSAPLGVSTPEPYGHGFKKGSGDLM